MALGIHAMLGIGLASGVSAGEPGVESKSKLGVFVIGSYTDGTRSIVQHAPRVLKVLDPQANSAVHAAALDFAQRNPQGVTVVRIWRGTPGVRYELTDDPVLSAEDFWELVLEPAALELTPDEGQRVYLEGPNEDEHTPTWESVESARWFGRFWVRLAERIAEAEFRPCIGSIKAGQPSGTRAEVEAKLEAFVPALHAARKHGGAWSYHAFSRRYTTDPKVESESSLRYRSFYAFLKRRQPALASLPLILSESGVGVQQGDTFVGWADRGDVRKLQRWLTWFDGELRKDPYVIGAALFEIGDPKNWPAFDLEPAADWISAHLRTSR